MTERDLPNTDGNEQGVKNPSLRNLGRRFIDTIRETHQDSQTGADQFAAALGNVADRMFAKAEDYEGVEAISPSKRWMVTGIVGAIRQVGEFFANASEDAQQEESTPSALDNFLNRPIPMRVARVYAPIAAGFTMLFGPRIFGGLHTAEAQEAPINFGFSNVVPDITITADERTALAVLRGEVTPGVRMPVPLGVQPEYSYTSTGAIVNLTNFVDIPNSSTDFARLMTGTSRREFTIPGFADNATLPVRNMFHLLGEIESQNTEQWSSRTDDAPIPNRFASLVLKAKDNDAGTTTSVTAEIVVGDQPITLNFRRDGENRVLNFTPGSRLTLNPEDGTFRYIKASLANGFNVDTVDVNTTMREALANFTLVGSNQPATVDAPINTPALIEQFNNTLQSIVISSPEGIGSLSFRRLPTTVESGTRFRSSPDRSGGDANVVGTYVPAQGDVLSPQQPVTAADFMGSDAYWQLRRAYPGLGVDQNGLMQVTIDAYDENNPDRYWHLFTNEVEDTLNLVWFRSDKVNVNPSSAVVQEIPTPVAVAMAPELSASGALGMAYSEERLYGGGQVYTIAFNGNNIYEPPLEDPAVTDILEIPQTNAQWLSTPRDIMYTESGQERFAPLGLIGYYEINNNIFAILPIKVTSVLRRPYAGRGGAGDRVLTFEIPTAGGTISVAQSLSDRIRNDPGQSPTRKPDAIFTPNAQIIERLLNSTIDTPLPIGDVLPFVTSNPNNPEGFEPEEEITYLQQSAESDRMIYVSMMVSAQGSRLPNDILRIVENQPPRVSGVQVDTSLEMTGYLRFR